MSDRPMLFSAPMVRALLDGTKTQTRRLIKLRNRFPDFRGGRGDWDDAASWGWDDDDGQHIGLVADGPCSQHWAQYRGACHIGDRLWVRESWQLHSRATDLCTVAYMASVNHTGWNDAHEQFPDHVAGKLRSRPFQEGWRPSIHMPRWASRLTLTVTDVRVERLQDISEVDAKAEGLQHRMDWMPQYRGTDDLPWRSEFPRDAFCDLWNSINGPDAWGQNPWVVALTFDVHKGNIDA